MRSLILLGSMLLLGRPEHLMGSSTEAANVVQQLYAQVVARHPLGIPKGDDREAIFPMLSTRLRSRLEVAQACEADYFRSQMHKDEKPEFPWLESGLFSGENEEALPTAAIIKRSVPQSDGSVRVFVGLEYKSDTHVDTASDSFRWEVVAVVVSDNGRFAVDDILIPTEGGHPAERKLSTKFAGCDGPRWIGLPGRKSLPTSGG